MARVLAHAHSTWSHDGTLSLERWVMLARERGYEAILLTEHEETGWTPERYNTYIAACEAASTKEVKLIPGIEFSQDGFHILCYGLQKFPPRPTSASELAAAVHAQGCCLCLAHPGKYRWRHPASLLSIVDAVEVWNSKWIYDGILGPHPNSLRMAEGKALFAGQDVHKPKHFSSLHIETATANYLMDLKAGHYRIVSGNTSWSPEELRSRLAAGALQYFRTEIMRIALNGYRLARKASFGKL